MPRNLSSLFVEHRQLTTVLLIGAFVRLLLIVWFHGQPIFIADAKEYKAIALNVFERGEFAVTPGQPTSIRPPLYPVVMAGIYQLMGAENHTAVRAVQAVLGLLTTVIVYRLARAMYPGPVAIWAAVGVCFYPSLVFTGNLLLTETLFTFWLCLFCWLIQRYLTTAGVGVLLAAGAVLGLAALTRSVVWLFPPFLVLFLFWAARERRGTVEGDLGSDVPSCRGGRLRGGSVVRRAMMSLARCWCSAW
jgi:4-amino-4-deoxy-L-arabinose transferase-like glycosyltransferase